MAAATGPATRQDLSEILRQFAGRIADMGHDRLELLKMELADERRRLGRAWRDTLYAIVAAIFTSQMLVLLLAVLVWNTQWRLPAIAGGTLTALSITVLLFRSAFSHPGSTLLDHSLAELAKDRKALESLQ